ncbi:MAG: phosphoribosylanthranilate isomerase [Eubacterium sp.]|nr:phosphoribosylanthranilate isomerase [Eubacterium sp.]
MKIKICGMMRPEDIGYVNIAKPDYIGFIFAKNRKRTVTKQQATEMKALLSPDIQAVGVFLDNDIDEVIDIADSGTVDLIQLHGSEDEEYVNALRTAIPADMPIIKAFSIKTQEDIDNAFAFPADFILLDNGIGGTGEAFSWELIDGGLHEKVFLAGGVNTDNIADAIRLSPYCIDVSSGAETDGVKDKEKILALINAVRSAY